MSTETREARRLLDGSASGNVLERAQAYAAIAQAEATERIADVLERAAEPERGVLPLHVVVMSR